MNKIGTDNFTKNLYENNYEVYQVAYKLRQRSVKSIRTTSENKSETTENDAGNHLFKNMRGFLIIGRILGILPVSGIFRKSTYTSMNFK